MRLLFPKTAATPSLFMSSQEMKVKTIILFLINFSASPEIYTHMYVYSFQSYPPRRVPNDDVIPAASIYHKSRSDRETLQLMLQHAESP